MSSTSTSRYSYAPQERDLYGLFYATLVDSATGELRSESFAGMSTVEATRKVVALCKQLGPSWRVRCLSHPLSILRDLDNDRQPNETPMRVESALLKGRSYLIEGEVRSLHTTGDSRRERRERLG